MFESHLRPGSDPDMDPPIPSLLGRDDVQEQQPEDANLKPAQGACVVCFEPLTQPCKLVPCGHQNFHIGCVHRWLGSKPSCPICNATVVRVVHGPAGQQLAIEYPTGRTEPQAPSGPRVPIPNLYPPPGAAPLALNHLQFGQGRTNDEPAGLEFRREVYRLLRYSRPAASDGLSGGRVVTRDMFRTDANLKSRANAFLRRELRVFSWLTVPDIGQIVPVLGEIPVSFMARKEFTTADRMITHVVQLLQHFEIKSSGGVLEEALAASFGPRNAKLLLHELHSFLCSPYDSLQVWDRMVQYPDVPQQRCRGADEEDEGADRGRDLGRDRRGEDRYASNRYMERYRARNDFIRPGQARSATNRPSGLAYEPYGRPRTSNRNAGAQGHSGRGGGRESHHEGHQGHPVHQGGDDHEDHDSCEAPWVVGPIINLCGPTKR